MFLIYPVKNSPTFLLFVLVFLLKEIGRAASSKNLLSVIRAKLPSFFLSFFLFFFVGLLVCRCG